MVLTEHSTKHAVYLTLFFKNKIENFKILFLNKKRGDLTGGGNIFNLHF